MGPKAWENQAPVQACFIPAQTGFWRMKRLTYSFDFWLPLKSGLGWCWAEQRPPAPAPPLLAPTHRDRSPEPPGPWAARGTELGSGRPTSAATACSTQSPLARPVHGVVRPLPWREPGAHRPADVSLGLVWLPVPQVVPSRLWLRVCDHSAWHPPRGFGGKLEEQCGSAFEQFVCWWEA